MKKEEHEPDSWVVFKVNNEQPHYRLLTGYRGNYQKNGKAVHEEWHVSGGIVNCEDDKDQYVFTSSNGSKYICHKTEYYIQHGNMHVWDAMNSDPDKDVTKLKRIEEFETWDWIIK